MLPPSVAATAMPQFKKCWKQATASLEPELLAIMDPVWKLSSRHEVGLPDNSSKGAE